MSKKKMYELDVQMIIIMFFINKKHHLNYI